MLVFGHVDVGIGVTGKEFIPAVAFRATIKALKCSSSLEQPLVNFNEPRFTSVHQNRAKNKLTDKTG